MLYIVINTNIKFISMFANGFVYFCLFSWAPQIVNLACELILKNKLEVARWMKGKCPLVKQLTRKGSLGECCQARGG